MADTSKLLINSIRDVTVVTFEEISILDTIQVDYIGDTLNDLIDNRAVRKLVLDFANVRFLSSSALGVLITAQKKISAIKGQLILCGLRDELKKVFTISRLDKLFKFAKSEEEALATFGVSTAG